MADTIADLHILVLDCQATGANPQQGHLLEIGWASCHPRQSLASVANRIETHILRLPDQAPLPHRIKRITGISDQDILSGQGPRFVWKRLRKAGSQVARRNRMRHCPVVIHFARYEAAFLEQLQQLFSNGNTVPFQLLCTHQISRKLLPGLPRRGLRAVAGFLGHAVAPPRRSAPHVAATFYIWRHFLSDLVENEGLRTLADLHRWLRETAPVNDVPRKYPLDRTALGTIPAHPGVYRFLRAGGEALYIGKSKSLKRRVRSYYNHRKGLGDHILEMLSQAQQVTYDCTDTALEAALCESDAIKRLSPPYNRALQVGQRQVGVISWHLPMPAGHRRRTVTLGPVPNDTALELLPDILDRYRDPAAGSAAYQQWLDKRNGGNGHLPPPDVFDAALEMFHLQYHRKLNGPRDHFTQLLFLGARFWCQRRMEKNLPAEKLSQGEDSIEAEHQDWPPRQALRFVESMICRAAHLIRRAQWFGLLAHAALTWQTDNDSGGRHRTLVIQEGHITARGYGAAGMLRKAHYCRHLPPRPERQTGFSVSSYDRMRVLTTEMKRIVGDGRPVRLQLGQRQIDGSGLASTLNWL
jgi:DNA polymerase-3 subunit epsilon